MPDGFSNPYKLDDSISILRVIDCFVCVFFLIFIEILIEYSVCKQWIPLSDVASGLCLSVSVACKCPTKRTLGLNGLMARQERSCRFLL